MKSNAKKNDKVAKSINKKDVKENNEKKSNTTQEVIDKHSNPNQFIEQVNNTLTESFDCFDPAGRFDVRDSGVYFVFPKKEDEEESREIRVCGLLRASFWTVTLDGDNHGKVFEWTDRQGKKHSLMIGNELIQTETNKIRSVLAKQGLDVKPKGGGGSRDYLQLYLYYANPKEKAFLATKLGWDRSPDDGTYFYVLPTKTIGGGKTKIVFDNRIHNMQWICTAGSLEEWKNQISKIAVSSSFCVFAISTVFASSLLDILEGYIDNRFFEFSGISGAGKSLTLKIAQSVLGFRDKLPTWRSTPTGLERMALAHNDCTMFLDEIGVSDRLDRVPNDIYSLCGGSTKIRSDISLTESKIETWRLFGLATGEFNIKQLGEKLNKKVMAGQEIRMADIPVKTGGWFGTFEEKPQGCKDKNDLLTKLSTALYTQYGTAFEEWIIRLVDLRNFAMGNLKQTLIDEVNKFVVEAFEGKEYEEQIERVCRSYGLVAVAGELASGNDLLLFDGEEKPLNITGWDHGIAWRAGLSCFKAWVISYGASKLSKEERDIISNANWIFETQQSRFARRGDEYLPKDQIGFKEECNSIDNEDGLTYYYIGNESFKRNFCNGNNIGLVKSVLEKNGYLQDTSRAFGKKRLKHTVLVYPPVIKTKI